MFAREIFPLDSELVSAEHSVSLLDLESSELSDSADEASSPESPSESAAEKQTTR